MGNSNLKLFKETPYFHWKYGYEARLEDLTKSSIDYLLDLEKKLLKNYNNFIRSDEIRKGRKNLAIKKEAKDRWRCMVSTAPLAATTAPYFPKKLGKLLRKGPKKFYEFVHDDIGDMLKEWDIDGGWGTSRKERVKNINYGTDRNGDKSDGYAIFQWEKIDEYFNEEFIKNVGHEKFWGGRIEVWALNRMCKDRKHVVKHYPDFRPLDRFNKRYSPRAIQNGQSLYVHKIWLPENWEVYI